jgi:protein O-mannosyl-transferase
LPAGHRTDEDRRRSAIKLLAMDCPRTKNRPPTSCGSDGRVLWAVSGLLLLAVFLIYGQTIGHEFVNFDDSLYVIDNPWLTQGLSVKGIVWAFTNVYAKFWHPVTWLSLLLDFQLYGLRPWGYHLTNVLLHAASSIILWLAMRRMTGNLWASAAVAALFAIHPLHVESAAWVAERKDVLGGFFFILTLAAYASYVQQPASRPRYLWLVAVFALSLMAKPLSVTLPFVFLMLDYWPLGRWKPAGVGPFFGVKTLSTVRPADDTIDSPSRALAAGRGSAWRLIVEKIPLLLLSAVFCVVTTWAEGEAVIATSEVPLSLRLVNVPLSYVAYLAQFLYPARMAVYYPHPTNTMPASIVIIATILLLAISAGALAGWRRYPYLSVGWFWYLGTLVPMIGLVQIGYFARADRFSYVTQIGLYIAVVWGVAQLTAAGTDRRWLRSVVAIVAAAALLRAAWQQTTYWHDSERLWAHAVACTEPNTMAYDQYGSALDEHGREADAILCYQKAIALDPKLPQPHYNYGVILHRKGMVDEAMAHYRATIKYRPDFADAYYNLAIALAQRSQTDEAITQLRQALQIKPELAEAHESLATILGARGHSTEAMAQYRQALEINPNLPRAHLGLATLLQQQGDTAAAIAQWREAVRLLPNNLSSLNQLAWLLATSPDPSLRNGAEAVALAERAVQRGGAREPAVLGTLAAAYAEAGQPAKAAETAQRALALATAQGNAAMANILRARIKLYLSGNAYHEPPPPRRP